MTGTNSISARQRQGTLFGSVGTVDKVIGRSLYPLLPFLVFFLRENFRCRYSIYFDIEFLLKDVWIIESSLIILLKTLFMYVILALVLLKGFHHFFKLLIIGRLTTVVTKVNKYYHPTCWNRNESNFHIFCTHSFRSNIWNIFKSHQIVIVKQISSI